jgi:trehalose/maltose hydrolase-like predicted phosphorylase
MKLNDTLAVDPDGWVLVERGWDAERSVAVGSSFLCGNGYLGYRGTTAEQRAKDYVALVVTDTYDCADGKWRELTTAPNPLFVAARAGQVRLSVENGSDVEARIDLRAGVYSAAFTQEIDGVSVRIEVTRFASYDQLHLMAQRWTVSADGDIAIDLDTGIDADLWSLNGVHLPHIDITVDPQGRCLATATTGESGIALAVASASRLVTGEDEPATEFSDDKVYGTRRSLKVQAGRPVVVETVASVFSANDASDPAVSALALVTETRDTSYNALAAASLAHWDAIWSTMDVTIEGDLVSQAALRFSAYHNRICTPAHSDHLPVGARGLSCQAYQGSAFWDQEVYNLPAFLFTEPEIARSLLIYRHRTLDGARRKAARLGYQGAYFAWVSGVTGDELCPDVFFVDVLTGRPIRNHFNVWQMHVSPDIVSTIERYVDVTGDVDYLVEYGAEIAFEVARFLRSFVRYDDANGTYHCMRLLGPDEWHENVDDNAFTNYQSRAALDYALRIHALLAAEHPEALARLADKISLLDDELDAWRRVRAGLALPAPDPATGVVEQFKGFSALEDVSPAEVRSRLINPAEYWGWPNGVAVSTQVSKQADVPMLMWLQRNRFSKDVQAANYDHYLARCAHGSSLSHAAFGMLAVQIGETEEAFRHFQDTSTVDLLNTHHAVVAGTFIGGIHTAACGGTYQLAVNGFGGLDFTDDGLVIAPHLPQAWTSLGFPISWRGHRARVVITHDGVTVTADVGNPVPLTVQFGEQQLNVGPGESVGGSAGESGVRLLVPGV